jgi:hypothetical protein
VYTIYSAARDIVVLKVKRAFLIGTSTIIIERPELLSLIAYVYP